MTPSSRSPALSPWRRRLGRRAPSGFVGTRSRHRPRFDVMEDRTLLSSFVVSNTDDSGPGSLRQAILDANAQRGADDDHLRPDRVRNATDDHPDLRPARAERHDRDRDDHGPGGGRDGQRRRGEPGVPGRRGCHGVDLGTDDHRRQQRGHTAAACTTGGTTTLTDCTITGNSAGNGGGCEQPRHGHAHRLHRSAATPPPPPAAACQTAGGTLTLTNCTVSGNSAGSDGGGLYNYRRHDHADQLHRQRQLRRRTAAACTTTLAARPR